MKLKLLAVGNKIPQWVVQGYEEYAKRLPKDMQLILQEIPLGYRSKSASDVKAIEQEDRAMMAAIDDKDWVVALEVTGKAWSTQQLANQCEQWRMQGQSVLLLVGGPNGLGQTCLERANSHWSLSCLTLPHSLVRILLAEQLYRAWSLLNNHPYHK